MIAKLIFTYRLRVSLYLCSVDNVTIYYAVRYGIRQMLRGHVVSNLLDISAVHCDIHCL